MSLVFVSYSRKDYYFAESLAFHLLQRGVPAWLDVKDLRPGVDWESELEKALAAASCVVLVGSAHAVSSPNVRAEWQRAAARGTRIVVAWFHGVRLPDELRRFEVVDFRGAFGRALERLAASLAPNPPKARAAGRTPRLPPWVAAVTGTVTVPLAAYVALGLIKGDMTGVEAWMYPLIVALLLGSGWFFCFSFLKRRMGMTRLALCLAALAAVYAYPVLVLFWRGRVALEAVYQGNALLIVNHWRAGALLATVPLAGLAVLLLIRPEDLLRWSPTGKVWNWYRTGRAAELATHIPDAAGAMRQLRRFHLVYDLPDAPAAARLHQELVRHGAQPAPGDPLATAVLLLTNQTHTAWLNGQTDRLQGAVLSVVACAISLPPILGWLWRRQWIDFRRWELDQPGRRRRLPGVPEAVTHPRLPPAVARAHHLLCAYGALLFALAGAIQPPDSARSDNVSPLQVVGTAAAFVGVSYAMAARGLARREMFARVFARWTGWIAVLGVISGVVCLNYFVIVRRSPLPAVPAVAFLFAAPVLLRRVRPALAFWFPLRDPTLGKPGDQLRPGRNWRTLAWLLVYFAGWVIVLGGPRE